MHCSKNFSCYGEVFDNENVRISVMIEQKILKNEKFCSFEVFSALNITEETCEQLFAGLESCCPLFYSITWHGRNQLLMENQSSLKYFLKFPNITLLHLTARGLNKQDVMHVLKSALDVGKTNIFALRGETEMLDEELAAVDFPYAVDLVKFIRSQFGSKFSICVAGYPQQHPDSSSKESDLSYLKAKVDAGADFIISQIIFESESFIEFVKNCRRIGIRVPIIPGIILLSSYDSLLNMSKRCKADIPQKILQDLELMKEDDAAIQEYGINLSVKLVEEIFKSGTSIGIHIFTLNRFHLALEFCKRVGLCEAKTNSNVRFNTALK
ncbi:methylenetetrahydrofolate reductase [Athalia rosae]|uniref:methylenetetrahydrofolate reductase n=1 Tax=Athalia rosae TaxID=37344 RepID=UPI0006259E91|nr:methylenetetrahydrofolate reductase [Athalia rosae]